MDFQGGVVREWEIDGGGRTLHRSRPLDSVAKRSPGGVVRQVGNGLVVAGESAQIVTVGSVAEDLERERERGTVGGWQEQRIDLDRWIC